MYIFYDFETSQKDFRPNPILLFCIGGRNIPAHPRMPRADSAQPIELPACGAIQVNQLSINDCIQHGQPEFEAANTVYDFLQTATNAHGHIPLVGFNSARFDFKHLEKLLLKHGLSPTFYGKISSLDIYQFSRHCAIHYSDTFPFTRKSKWRPNHSVFVWKI